MFYNVVMAYIPPEKYRPKPFNPNKKPERVPGFTVVSFVGLLIAFAAKYALDFLLFPKLFPDLYPFSVGAVIVWVISMIAFLIAALEFITGMGFFYPVAILVYAILVAIWPLNLYGAGEYMPGFVLAIIMGVIIYILQRIILWIMVLLSFIKS